jgi:hypothetical protein
MGNIEKSIAEDVEFQTILIDKNNPKESCSKC